MNLLFNIFCSNLGSRKWKSNNSQLARENAKLKRDVQKWFQLHTEESVRYNVLEMSWRRRGVSNFRFYEGASLFDFIRPWLPSFGNTVAKHVVCRKSGVGNLVKNHAHSLPSISKDLQTVVKLFK